MPLPTAVPPQCKALYDFRVSDVEEKDCLSFNKADLISVIRRVDENWAEGKLGERIGIFPISFVEMNAAAKSLMKLATFNSSAPSRMVPPTPAISQSQEPSVSGIITHVTGHQATQQTNVKGNTDESSASSPSSCTSPSSAPCTPSPTSSSSSSLSMAVGLPTNIPAVQTNAQALAYNVVSAANLATTNLPAITPSFFVGQPIPLPELPFAGPAVSNNQKRHSLCAPSSSSSHGFTFAIHQRSNSHQQESDSHRHSMEILSTDCSSVEQVTPDLITSNWPEFNRHANTRSSCMLGVKMPLQRSTGRAQNAL